MNGVRTPGLTAWIAALGLMLAAPIALAAETKLETKVEAGATAADDDELDEVTRRELKEMEEHFAPAPQPKPLDASKLGAEEKRLLKRVQTRWDALIAFDLKKVYGFASPSYRQAHDQNYFNAQYHNRIARESAEVVAIDFVDDKKTQARVKVKLNFQMFPASMPLKEPLPGVAWENETWVKQNGQWWFVEPR